MRLPGGGPVPATAAAAAAAMAAGDRLAARLRSWELWPPLSLFPDHLRLCSLRRRWCGGSARSSSSEPVPVPSVPISFDEDVALLITGGGGCC